VNHPKARLVLAFALLSTAASPVLANTWYRFVNDDGVTVIAHAIPPQFVHKGYEVLDQNGRVIRVIDRQPTAAEIAEREAAQAREQAQEHDRQARQRRDQELMVLYSSPEDVQLARQRRLQGIDNHIRITQSNIERLQHNKRRLEAQAAARERAGQSPSAEVLESIRIVEAQIRDREHEVEARRRERAQVGAQYDADYERTRILYGRAAN
jgi:hypothetical protein